ncbi:MAG: hypothetical protein ACLFUT_05480 [Desulfobacteraceae bacterium]
MRVTYKQMLNIVTRSVAARSEQLMKAQERVASMKMINRPSDDPAGMNRVLDYRKRIVSIDQYLRNIMPAKTRVEMTVNQLEEVHGLLREAKQIAGSQAVSDNVSGQEMAAAQIGDIYDQIRAIANTRLGGSYIFSGHVTDTLPFSEDGTYHGDDGEIKAIVGEGVLLKINAHGDETFTGDGVTDGVDIFEVLKDLKDALEADPYDAGDTLNQIDPLNQGIAQIQNTLSRQSTTFDRLEQTEDKWRNLKHVFESTVSKTEDADMAQVVVELKAQQNAYEMTLATAAGVLQQNLLDFLR